MNSPKNLKEKSILNKLIENGVDENDIEFMGNTSRSIRYQYWRKMSQEQLKETGLIEIDFEDDDGEGERGKPIILHLYYYSIPE